MESFYKSYIDTNTETDNLVYNVVNSGSPEYLFAYCVIIVIVTFLSTKLTWNTNILIGLIFCSIIIYYIYTYRKKNILTENEIFKEKFSRLYTENQILSKYNQIVDFLFYMGNFKSNNIQQFENLVSLFENFCKVYEYCLLDNNLIFSSYQDLVDQKILILNTINSFIFTTLETEYQNILIKQKIAAEKILDKLLNNLILLKKKKIYYDGYNISTNNVNYSNVLAYNYLYQPDYRKGYDQYNISDLIYF
jgi:hypothetical protein